MKEGLTHFCEGKVGVNGDPLSDARTAAENKKKKKKKKKTEIIPIGEGSRRYRQKIYPVNLGLSLLFDPRRSYRRLMMLVIHFSHLAFFFSFLDTDPIKSYT